MMTTAEIIGIAMAIIGGALGAANVYIMLLIKLEVGQLRQDMSDKFLSKEDFHDTMKMLVENPILKFRRRQG